MDLYVLKILNRAMKHINNMRMKLENNIKTVLDLY